MSEQDIRPASPAVDSKINAEDGRKYWQSKLLQGGPPPHSLSLPPSPPLSLAPVSLSLRSVETVSRFAMLTGLLPLFFSDVDADVNGMLGGFPYVSRIDLQGSRNFLAKFGVGTKPGLKTVGSALEGGAG